jgi:hypothetical protein
LATVHAHASTADVTSIAASSVDGKVLLATCATDGACDLTASALAVIGVRVGTLAIWNADETAPLTQLYQRKAAQVSDASACLCACD